MSDEPPVDPLDEQAGDPSRWEFILRLFGVLFIPSRWFSYTRRLEWENERLREELAEYREREQEQRHHERVLYNSLLKQARAVPVPLPSEEPRQKTTSSVVSMRPSYGAIQKEHRSRMAQQRAERVASLSPEERERIRKEAQAFKDGTNRRDPDSAEETQR